MESILFFHALAFEELFTRQLVRQNIIFYLHLLFFLTRSCRYELTKNKIVTPIRTILRVEKCINLRFDVDDQLFSIAHTYDLSVIEKELYCVFFFLRFSVIL